MENQTIPASGANQPTEREKIRSYIINRYAERIAAQTEKSPLKASEEIILALVYIKPRTMSELLDLLPQYCQSCISRTCSSLVETGLVIRSGAGRNNNTFSATRLADAYEERMRAKADRIKKLLAET